MKNFTKISLLLVLLAAVLFTACEKQYDSIQVVDENKITSYIQKNNLSGMMIQDPNKTGFYYQVTTQGTGDFFKNTDSVLYNLTLKSLEGGNLYLQSPTYTNLGTYVGYLNSFYQSSLSSTGFDIPAIRTATLALKPGGTARILIPSYLAFGRNGAGVIPSNDIIDFYITTSIYKKQYQLDDNKILTYLSSKGLSAIKDASRIYYIVNTLGTGAAIESKGSTVVIKYTCRTIDGTVHDSSTDGTFSTALTTSNVIAGWGDIIPKFPVGTKMRIFIPSDLGYSTSGNGTIPPNAVLDFDIEIVSVTN